MWDGCSLDEVWGEIRYFCDCRRGIDTQKVFQKSLYDLHKSPEGDGQNLLLFGGRKM